MTAPETQQQKTQDKIQTLLSSSPMLAKVLLDCDEKTIAVNLGDLVSTFFARDIPHLIPCPTTNSNAQYSVIPTETVTCRCGEEND